MYDETCRTPTFTEELLSAETGEEDALKAPERSFWSKYVSGILYLLKLVQLNVCKCKRIEKINLRNRSKIN